MESDVVVRRVSDGLQQTLGRLSTLASAVAVFAGLVGIATFATGWWIFDGSGRSTWVVIGGLLCLVPVVAALCARILIGLTAKHSPELLDNVRSFLDRSTRSAKVLIDHDTGQRVSAYAKSFGSLRGELREQRRQLPALFAGVRAICTVPGLAAMAVLGTCAIGVLGTILLIGGLID